MEKGTGQILAEKTSANPFAGKTSNQMVAASMGSGQTPRYDAPLDQVAFPTNAIDVPPGKAPIKPIYRHDSGGAGMDK